VERALVYLALLAAVLALAAQAPALLRPRPDYCSEAERLAAAVLSVYLSGGSVVDEYYLRGVRVGSGGISCEPCGVSLAVPLRSELGAELEGRRRLLIYYDFSEGAVVLSELDGWEGHALYPPG